MKNKGNSPSNGNKIIRKEAQPISPRRAFSFISAVLPDSIRRFLKNARIYFLTLGLRDRDISEFVQETAEIEAGRQVTIVVAICDAPEVLNRCLQSLERFASSCEVVLVDDGSRKQETLTMIEDFSIRNSWKRIRFENSAGHSRSCEAGASNATRPYLCFLNSDTVVTHRSWHGIISAFEADQAIGIVGPTTSKCSGPQQIGRAFHCRYYWTDAQICLYSNLCYEKHKDASPIEIETAVGFAFFIRMEAWKELQGFDSNLPDYGNEKELCIRARLRGWRVVYCRSSYIHHFGGMSYDPNVRGLSYRKRLSALRYIEGKYK